MSNLSQTFCYTVKDLKVDNRSDRFDAHFYDPRYFELIRKLSEIGKKKGMAISKLEKILLEPSKTHLTGGATPRGAAYLTEGIRFVRVQNVKENKIDFENAVFIEPRIHEGQLRRSKLKPRDVVLTITGTWGLTGKYGIAAVVPDNVGKANINQHSVKIELDETTIDANYFSHFINSQLGRTQIYRAVTGSTRSALSYPTIKSLLILFPINISIQKEIVLKVNKIYDSAYEKLDERKKLLNTLDNIIIDKIGIKLPNEYSKTCFTADIGNSKRLDALSKSPYLYDLRECIKKIPHETLENLVTFPKPDSPFFNNYYRLVDLRNVEERTGRVKVIEVDNLGSDKILLHKGIIYINCLSPEKPKTILADEELDSCVASTEFTPIEILPNIIEPDYLLAVLRSKIIIDQWKYQITGSTPSRERLGENELRATLIPKPNESIRKEIGLSIKEVLHRISVLEQAFNNEIEYAKKVFLESLNEVTTII